MVLANSIIYFILFTFTEKDIFLQKKHKSIPLHK